MPRQRIELLAPAGNFEKLETAIHFGADAVYLGGSSFSLRNFSGNFTIDGMGDAIAYAHGHGAKVYVAVNVFARTAEQNEIAEYLAHLGRIRPDAVILADPGVFMMARDIIGDIPVHISTQANTTSCMSAAFWAELGATRINAARELSLTEIKAIAETVPIEVEAFAHGAMCVSYSGRCLLSNYLAGRDANRGSCAHACRWRYHLVEETRPGKFMPIEQDDRGTYIFNARDLCTIEHIPELIEAGIASLKIEGRMKGLNYLAATVKTYRQAIDAYYTDPAEYQILPEWKTELETINYRGYSTGFFFNDPAGLIPNFDIPKTPVDHRYVGKVVRKPDPFRLLVDIRNKTVSGDCIEIVSPVGPARLNTICEIIGPKGDSTTVAQPNTRVTLVLETADDCGPGDILRRTGPGARRQPGAGQGSDNCKSIDVA